ncbi:MAG: ABC transporter permease subunit [Candidatus Micrarchaeia archaeon]
MRFFDKASQDPRWAGAMNAVALVFFCAFVLGPLFYIFSQIGHFTFNDGMRNAIIASFSIGLAVTLVDLAFGIPLAWLLAKKKFPLKGVLDAIVDLPLIVPTSALGLSITLFWGTGGLGLFEPGIAAIIVLHIAFTFSYVVRTTQAAIMEVDSDLARAAGTLGASPLTSFRTLWLPLVRAGALSGAVLAFTRSLGETGATMIAAGTLRTVPILTVYYKNATPADIDAAISLSAVFLLLSAALFLLVRSKLNVKRATLGRVYADAEKRLSSYGWLSDGVALAFLLGIVLLPSFWFLRFTNFDFFAARTIDAILVSFGVAAAATLLTIAFGLPLALLITDKRKYSWLLRLLVELGMVMPTVTIGLSLSLFWAGKLDEVFVLVFAHVAMIYPFFVSPVAEILSETDENLVQVARSLGAKPFYAFRTVVLPIIWPTVIAGTVVAFMKSVSETGGTLAVSKNIETIPLLIVNLTKNGQQAEAASAAVLLLAVSLVFVMVLRGSQRKKP